MKENSFVTNVRRKSNEKSKNLFQSNPSRFYPTWNPLAPWLGVKNFDTIALIFSSIWWIYAVALFVKAFLIEGRHKRNKSEKRKEGGPLGSYH